MGELKGTGVHVAKPLLLWERGQTEEKETPLSLRLSHIPIFALSISFPPPLLPRSLSAREPGWLEIQMTNESTQLSLLLPLFIFQITFALSFTSAL